MPSSKISQFILSNSFSKAASEKLLYERPNLGNSSLRTLGNKSRHENCAKWSDMLETTFPPLDLTAQSFMKMLSIRVAEDFMTQKAFAVKTL